MSRQLAVVIVIVLVAMAMVANVVWAGDVPVLAPTVPVMEQETASAVSPAPAEAPAATSVVAQVPAPATAQASATADAKVVNEIHRHYTVGGGRSRTVYRDRVKVIPVVRTNTVEKTVAVPVTTEEPTLAKNLIQGPGAELASLEYHGALGSSLFARYRTSPWPWVVGGILALLALGALGLWVSAARGRTNVGVVAASGDRPVLLPDGTFVGRMSAATVAATAPTTPATVPATPALPPGWGALLSEGVAQEAVRTLRGPAAAPAPTPAPAPAITPAPAKTEPRKSWDQLKEEILAGIPNGSTRLHGLSPSDRRNVAKVLGGIAGNLGRDPKKDIASAISDFRQVLEDAEQGITTRRVRGEPEVRAAVAEAIAGPAEEAAPQEAPAAELPPVQFIGEAAEEAAQEATTEAAEPTEPAEVAEEVAEGVSAEETTEASDEATPAAEGEPES